MWEVLGKYCADRSKNVYVLFTQFVYLIDAGIFFPEHRAWIQQICEVSALDVNVYSFLLVRFVCLYIIISLEVQPPFVYGLWTALV